MLIFGGESVRWSQTPSPLAYAFINVDNCERPLTAVARENKRSHACSKCIPCRVRINSGKRATEKIRLPCGGHVVGLYLHSDHIGVNMNEKAGQSGQKSGKARQHKAKCTLKRHLVFLVTARVRNWYCTPRI